MTPFKLEIGSTVGPKDSCYFVAILTIFYHFKVPQIHILNINLPGLLILLLLKLKIIIKMKEGNK